eukprot:29602-Pelagococcus_subviridis.AAC.5
MSYGSNDSSHGFTTHPNSYISHAANTSSVHHVLSTLLQPTSRAAFASSTGTLRVNTAAS